MVVRKTVLISELKRKKEKKRWELNQKLRSLEMIFEEVGGGARVDNLTSEFTPLNMTISSEAISDRCHELQPLPTAN